MRKNAYALLLTACLALGSGCSKSDGQAPRAVPPAPSTKPAAPQPDTTPTKTAVRATYPPVKKDPRPYDVRLALVAPDRLHPSCAGHVKITRTPPQWVKSPKAIDGKTDRGLQQSSVIQFGPHRLGVTEINPEPRDYQMSMMSITWNGKSSPLEVMEASGGMNGVFGPYCSPKGDLVVLLVEGLAEIGSTHYLFHRDGRKTVSTGGISTFVEEGYWHNNNDAPGYVLIDGRTLKSRLLGEALGMTNGWFLDGERRLLVGEAVLDVTRWDAPRKISDDAVDLWGGFWMSVPSGPDAATPYLVVAPENTLHPALYQPTAPPPPK